MELGRVSLQAKLYYSIINYWFKILENTETRYIRFARELMLADMEQKANIVNWASTVKNKNLVSNLDFYEVWLNQNVGNKNAFLREIRVRLTDLFRNGVAELLDRVELIFIYSFQILIINYI